MLEKSPLNDLEILLRERGQKRITFFAALLDSLEPLSDRSLKWFQYETEAVEKEMELLNSIMPEEIPGWVSELRQIKKKFEEAIQSIREVMKMAEKGEVKLVSDIYQRPSLIEEIPAIPLKIKKRKAPSNVGESILELWDAASELEKLVRKIEQEAIRVLRLRRLVKLEIRESMR